MCKTKEQLKIFRKAVDHWGFQLQIERWFEESAELTLALSKLLRSKAVKNYLDIKEELALRGSIIEEIADCEIILEQLKIIVDSKPEFFEVVKKNKVEKLEGLLK